MATFKAYLKKEILESSRQYRYIILAAGFLFFAIADPVMIKLLPVILKSQLGSGASDLSALLPPSTQLTGMQNYIKDLFQIANLVVVFTLCGSLSEELSSEKLIFPYSKGSSPYGIVLAKFINYSAVITFLSFISLLINYYYAGILLKGEAVSLYNVLLSACFVSLYFIFTVSLVLLFSSLFRKAIIAGILVLLINYFSVIFIAVKSISKFLPYELIQSAGLFKPADITITIITVILLCILFIALTILRMNKVEVV